MTREEAIEKGLCAKCRKRDTTEHKKWCGVCRAYYRNEYYRLHQTRRKIIFTHYGDRCKCCGESEPLFLAIDHINNDGGKQRRATTDGGKDMYRKLAKAITLGTPPKDLQLLCMNCNWGKYVNKGVCPHKAKVGG